jgi:hypothetical protein
MKELKTRIGEHLLCVAIDLDEARQELIDAEIKVQQIASKYNDLIEMKNKLDENDDNSDNTSVTDMPIFHGFSNTQ